MDTNTLKALSIVCTHETSDELQSLREEVKNLRKYKENVERNTKRLLDELSIVKGMLTEVHNSSPETLEEMLEEGYGRWAGDDDLSLSDTETEERVKYYWNKYEECFGVHEFDDYYDTNTKIHIAMFMHWLCMSKDEKTYEYALTKINSFEIHQYNNFDEKKVLIPNFEVYILSIDDFKDEIEPMEHLQDIRNLLYEVLNDIHLYSRFYKVYEEDKDIVPDESYKPKIFNKKTKDEFVIDDIEAFSQMYSDIVTEKKKNMEKNQLINK
tara:strand:+ start:283 stop:1086 length:804 start_codon:yes stop_codon:yes gene_type:complete